VPPVHQSRAERAALQVTEHVEQRRSHLRRRRDRAGSGVAGAGLSGRALHGDESRPAEAKERSRSTAHRARPLPQHASLIILPGTKSTIADLAFMRSQGWDIDLLAHVRSGGRVLGICGGYQMLGRALSDPEGIEGPPQSVRGWACSMSQPSCLSVRRYGLFRGAAMFTGSSRPLLPDPARQIARRAAGACRSCGQGGLRAG
jgi:hypothetical protein